MRRYNYGVLKPVSADKTCQKQRGICLHTETRAWIIPTLQPSTLPGRGLMLPGQKLLVPLIVRFSCTFLSSSASFCPPSACYCPWAGSYYPQQGSRRKTCPLRGLIQLVPVGLQAPSIRVQAPSPGTNTWPALNLPPGDCSGLAGLRPRDLHPPITSVSVSTRQSGAKQGPIQAQHHFLRGLRTPAQVATKE